MAENVQKLLKWQNGVEKNNLEKQKFFIQVVLKLWAKEIF